MRNRIEILKGLDWIELYLGEEKSVKYNALINRVGSMSTREISHSNTFSLPYVHQNIQALDINIFNPKQLAKAFNSKYIAKYFVKDRLQQEGFLVVNNTENGAINVNFIDGALDIVEKWGSMNYYQLLRSETLLIPEPYKAALDEMKAYNMAKDIILTPLPNMVGRDYPIAKFPNNLNAVGDRFQKPTEGNRLPDTFNPYQSRPIFNTKALFDIAIETFGYTPYYDDSINWDKIEKTYMIEKGLSQSEKNENAGSVTTTYPLVDSNSAYAFATLVPGYSYVHFVYPNEVEARTANQILPNSLYWIYYYSFAGNLGEASNVDLKDWRNLDRALLMPSQNNFTNGSMQWSFDTPFRPVFYNEGLNENVEVATSWFDDLRPLYNIFPAFRRLIGNLTLTRISTGWNISIVVPKSELGIKPIGEDLGEAPAGMVGQFLGLTLDITINNVAAGTPNVSIRNMVYSETTPEKDVVTYDQYDQYDSLNVDLRHAAPRSATVKELLSAIMQKEGILMSFNNRLKQIKLFSYSSYITRKNEGNYSDWSDYLRKYDAPLYNTDYGNEYAVTNEVGLSEPYKGNTYKLILANQVSGSKYKSYATNYNTKFKDIEALKLIFNPTTPYFEYTNKGLGLVEIGETNLGQLTQVTADALQQGTFTGLCPVSNVNYADLPNGVLSWYNLIDQSVRCQSKFLLPLDVVKNIKLEEPIYINNLGGFYIIEEIEEYIDAQTPVNVKLIKLPIDDFVTPLPDVPHFSDLHFSPLHFST